MEFIIDTSVKDDIITQELFKKEDNIKNRLSTWILNTRDEYIKKCLISLGWKPPNNKLNNKLKCTCIKKEGSDSDFQCSIYTDTIRGSFGYKNESERR